MRGGETGREQTLASQARRGLACRMPNPDGRSHDAAALQARQTSSAGQACSRPRLHSHTQSLERMFSTSGQLRKLVRPTEVQSWQPSMEWLVHTPCRPGVHSQVEQAGQNTAEG